VGRWTGGWDVAGLREFAENLRLQLGEQQPVTFGLVFATPGFFEQAGDLLEVLRVHGRIPVLAGCSSPGLVAGGEEHEEGEGVVLALYALPGATVRTLVLPGGEGDGTARARASGFDPAGVTGWLAFLEPFRTDPEAWINGWQSAFPGAPIYGGLAMGSGGEPRAQVYCNGTVLEEGGVVLAFTGVRVLGAVAQGCTPVGETWTITRVEGNIVHRIGNRPAFAVLEETFTELNDDLKQRSRGNFFAGLVVDEYRDAHQRGDFLVRSLLGADPGSGALAVGALPRVGQTLQFQLRDAAAADEDMRRALSRLRDEVKRATVYGGCLCVCAGRGKELFGQADHDAGLVQQIIGPTTNIAGFFCNGEIGPVGSRSFVHGHTAALLLFVGPAQPREAAVTS
jgi:small ligand-binding sensory domain FIST